MLPAIATNKVLLNFDNKFEIDKPVAVRKDMEDCFFLPLEGCDLLSSTISTVKLVFLVFSTPSNGRVSEVISPSFILTIREAYCSARSGLWVTMITR